MRNISLALLVCLLLFPAAGHSQGTRSVLMPSGIPPVSGESFSSLTGSVVNSIPGLGAFTAGKVVFNPFAMIGYQKTGVNMTVPMNVDYDPYPGIETAHLKMGSIDVTLEDFNFWYGTAGLNVILSPTVTLFGSVAGYLPRTFTQFGAQPVSFGPLASNVQFTMTGYGLELWTMQCGASLGFSKGYSVLLGSLWQHTSMKYDDMRIGSVPVNASMKQDFMLTNWAPFIGLQYLQPGAFRASVIYSPLLTSWGNLVCSTIQPVITTLTYSLNQPGYLLGVTGEYFVPVPKQTSLSVWLTGAASVISGDSEAQFEAPGISINRSATGLTVSQYSIGGGFTFGLVF